MSLKSPAESEKNNFKLILFCFLSRELLILTCDTICAHFFSLCTHPGLLKRPHFACSGLLNERLWEVVVLPQGRPCSTHVRVCYATAITVEDKENVSG